MFSEVTFTLTMYVSYTGHGDTVYFSKKKNQLQSLLAAKLRQTVSPRQTETQVSPHRSFIPTKQLILHLFFPLVCIKK